MVKTHFDSTMDVFINNPGLQYLAENIFLNLNHETLETCALVNQSFKIFLENHPMFWLKKLIFEGRFKKKNQKDCWTKAIHLTKVELISKPAQIFKLFSSYFPPTFEFLNSLLS